MLGKEHEGYSDCLNALSCLYEKQGNFSASESLLAAVAVLEQERIARAAAYLSERELAMYASKFQTDGAKLGAYLLARPAISTATMSALAFDHALFHKGFLLTAASRLNFPVSTSPNQQKSTIASKATAAASPPNTPNLWPSSRVLQIWKRKQMVLKRNWPDRW